MRLKYKISKKGKDIVVSLDGDLSCKITPEILADIGHLFPPKRYNASEELAIGAAKNEIHWRLTHRNMELHEYMGSMRRTLSNALGAEDIEKKNVYIKDALRHMNSFFDADERGVY